MRKQTLHPRTAVINQKQKNMSKKARLDALHWLQITFPAAFDNRIKIQPLSVGIMKEILTYADQAAEAGVSKSKLREAVVLFTRRLDYLACLKARDQRVDLFGNPVSDVAESDAEGAALKIKKRVEKSVKNARKLSSPSSVSEPVKRPKSLNISPDLQASNDFDKPLDRPMSVTVTRKASRQFDPAAVARLKEQLGISQKSELEKGL